MSLRTVFVVAFLAPGGGMHVAQDSGQVLAWQLPALAAMFAERLADLAALDYVATKPVTAFQLVQPPRRP